MRVPVDLIDFLNSFYSNTPNGVVIITICNSSYDIRWTPNDPTVSYLVFKTNTRELTKDCSKRLGRQAATLAIMVLHQQLSIVRQPYESNESALKQKYEQPHSNPKGNPNETNPRGTVSTGTPDTP